jgi:hypothetical protein
MAYNNRTFSETDFRSLKGLGDSQKVSNKLSTGKFGLGFSSVRVILSIELMIGLWMD